MKNFKKTLRLLGFGLLLVLATLGVGLGGTPLIQTKRRDDGQKADIELVERLSDASETDDAKDIKP